MQPDGFERLTIEIQEKRKAKKAGAQQNRQKQVVCSALLVSGPFAKFELMHTVTKSVDGRINKEAYGLGPNVGSTSGFPGFDRGNDSGFERRTLHRPH